MTVLTKLLQNSNHCGAAIGNFPATAATVAVINTAIAALLTALDIGKGFWPDLLVSQCIGMTLYAAHGLVYRWLGGHRAMRLSTMTLTILVGAPLGVGLATLIGGPDITGVAASHPSASLQTLLLGFVFGGAISYLFYLRAKMAAVEAAFQEQRVKHLAAEKQVVEARLRLLQAQIEPHFLFNTLANVQSLIDLDPPRAHAMLDRFIGYLRSTLARSREETATLGSEIKLIGDYLAIIAIRMGNRLRCEINVPADLSVQPMPPMLLQPLVENAVRHGLEPKPEGGTVGVVAQRHGDRLRVTVRDDGLGFGGETVGGLGLTNIRQRLRALYGNRARLVIESGTPNGTRVTVDIPMEKTASGKAIVEEGHVSA